MLYKKAVSDIEVIVEASKPTDVMDESDSEVIQNPKGNKGPLSTKHTAVPKRLFPQEYPLNSEVNNKKPSTARLKPKVDQNRDKGMGYYDAEMKRKERVINRKK